MWFSIILVALFLVTGFFWVLDKLVFEKQRMKAAAAIKAQMNGGHHDAVANALARPDWLEYTAGLFSVVALVFVLRSFLYEPFRIPSGSMLPTLYVGDFVLVNKYAYGLRMPILNNVIIPVGTPQRGDVVVFHYPLDTSTDYIKRVVGVGGDVVRYENKVLTVNGQVYAQTPKNEPIPMSEYPEYLTPSGKTVVQTNLPLKKATEAGARSHDVLIIENQVSVNPTDLTLRTHPNSNCTYANDGTSFECKVPQGKYFMMGDNRDQSADSRYWGFVDDKQIVGRAAAIWLHWHDVPSPSGFTLKRAGSLEGK